MQVLADNESFLTSAVVNAAHKKARVSVWQCPAKSPDLNPVEMFWAYLRKRLAKLDVKDCLDRRPVPTPDQYRARIRSLSNSKSAQKVAANVAATFRATCKLVVQKNGAASGR